jgi:hypothetical protein
MERVMRIANCRVALVAGIICAMSVMPQAQQTSSSTQTKNFEIIAVDGNMLVVRLPEGTKELTVPSDFRFMVDGKSLAVSELKAGMKGTASITTQTTVTPVTVTEVKSGTVFERSGGSIIVQTPEGFKSFTQGDIDKRGVKIVKNGKVVQLDDLRKGDKLAATIVTSAPPKIMTKQEVNASLARPDAAPAAAAPASRTASTPAATTSAPTSAPTAKTLPKTASTWPLTGLLSVLSLAAGLTLTIRRRLAA